MAKATAKKQTKYIFITGGVVSSLGKGITSASLALLLKSRGYNVFMQKLDPYLNVDPGTMSPYQHGEVFVTDAGYETLTSATTNVSQACSAPRHQATLRAASIPPCFPRNAQASTSAVRCR